MDAKETRIVAVDLGGTAIKSALVSGDGRILRKEKTPTEPDKGRDAVLANIALAIEKVLTPEVSAVGMGSPGHVDTKTGVLSWIENISCLNNCSPREYVAEKFKLPVHIDNDATNAVKGQYYFGSGRGAKHLLGLTLGTGVGGGLILNGRVHRGVIDYAGEIGHMTYIPDGMACTCGKRGCLEAYASATAIKRAARSLLKRGIPSRLSEHEQPDAKIVCDLAREGDESCRQIVQEAGKALGVVIGSVVNLLNPDRVVIGGGVADAGDVLFDQVRRYVSRHALPPAHEQCEILPGTLGNDAGILGCAAMIMMEST